MRDALEDRKRVCRTCKDWLVVCKGSYKTEAEQTCSEHHYPDEDPSDALVAKLRERPALQTIIQPLIVQWNDFRIDLQLIGELQSYVKHPDIRSETDIAIKAPVAFTTIQAWRDRTVEIELSIQIAYYYISKICQAASDYLIGTEALATYKQDIRQSLIRRVLREIYDLLDNYECVLAAARLCRERQAAAYNTLGRQVDVVRGGRSSRGLQNGS